MRKSLVHIIIRILLKILTCTDDSAIKAVPHNGPLILIGNHINFLDAPVAFTPLYPRPVVALVKEETFENPLLRFLFNTWGSISVKRGTADFKALGQALQALKQGKLLAVSPEGTRTNDGRLIQGQPGIVAIAIKSQVPILPIVLYGSEVFRENIRKLKRTTIKIQVGKPFKIKSDSHQPGREERQQITDEIMYQMAVMLPEEYRGYYSDMDQMTTDYLQFLPWDLASDGTRWQQVADTIGKHLPATEVAPK